MEITLLAGPGAVTTLRGEFASPSVALPPQLDWSSEAALLVDMGEQRTAGYGVTVTDVRRNAAGEVEVNLQVRRPGRGTFVAQVITHPHAVTPVPRAWLEGGPTTVVARDQHGHEVARQVVQL